MPGELLVRTEWRRYKRILQRDSQRTTRMLRPVKMQHKPFVEKFSCVLKRCVPKHTLGLAGV